MSGDGYVVVERESMTEAERALDDHIAEYSRTALELADLLATVSFLAGRAGAEAAMHVGGPEFAKHQGRLEMAREIADVIAKRIAVLTGGA